MNTLRVIMTMMEQPGLPLGAKAYSLQIDAHRRKQSTGEIEPD